MTGDSFWVFTQCQAARHDAVGDLSRDAIHDEDWPRRARTLRTLDAYLDAVGACDAARKALHQAYAEWKASSS